VACPEEIAFNLGYIDASAVRRLAQDLGKTEYARYLLDIVEAAPARDQIG
jgi:glucose-1-phosphate thymidylyltransferase